MNEADIFEELPTTVRYDVAAHILRNDLSGLDLFVELKDEQRHLLATRMTPKEVLPENELRRYALAVARGWLVTVWYVAAVQLVVGWVVVSL